MNSLAVQRRFFIGHQLLESFWNKLTFILKSDESAELRMQLVKVIPAEMEEDKRICSAAISRAEGSCPRINQLLSRMEYSLL